MNGNVNIVFYGLLCVWLFLFIYFFLLSDLPASFGYGNDNDSSCFIWSKKK